MGMGNGKGVYTEGRERLLHVQGTLLASLLFLTFAAAATAA